MKFKRLLTLVLATFVLASCGGNSTSSSSTSSNSGSSTNISSTISSTHQKVQQVVAQQLILHRVQLVLAHLIAQVANHHLHQVLLMKPIIIVVSTLI